MQSRINTLEKLDYIFLFFNQISPEPIPLDDAKMEEYEHSGLIGKNEPNIYTLEKYYSINQLRKILLHLKPFLTTQITEKELKPLEEFLKERWERVRGTDLAYPHSKKDALTILCMSIAQAIATVNGKNIFEILMPTLDVEAIDFCTSESLRERLKEDKLDIQQVVLSDDDTRIIDIEFSLNSACEDGQLKHTMQYNDFPNGIKLLNESEQLRVINHSPKAKEYYDAIQELKKIKKEGMSTGAFIQRLIDQLRNGGVYGGRGGQELLAAKDANIGISYFGIYIQSLSDQEKNDLFKLHARNETIENLWGRLARPHHTEFSQVQYCVVLIANAFESILQAHPFLYTHYPKQKTMGDEKCESKVNDAMLMEKEDELANKKDQFKQIISKDDYCVTATYGDSGKTLLKKHLLTKIHQEKKTLFMLFGTLLLKMTTDVLVELFNIRGLENKKWNFTQLAVKAGEKDLLETLFKQGLIKYNIEDNLVHIAADNNHYEIIKMLSLYLNIDDKDTNSFTPIYFAARKGHIEAVKTLIEYKVDINKVGNTLLNIAIENNQINLVKELLKHKNIDLMILNHEGLTPVAYAMYLSKLSYKREIIRELVKYDAYLAESYLQNKNMLSNIIKQNEWNILADLLIGPEGNHHIDVHYSPEEVLLLGIMRNQYLVVQHLAHAGVSFPDTLPAKKYKADLDLAVQNRWNPLHMAIFQNNPHLVNIVLTYGPTKFLNDEDRTGINPLQMAIILGKNIEIIDSLLKSYRKISSIGKSVLNLAIQNDRYDVIAAIFQLPFAEKEKLTLSHFLIKSNLSVSAILAIENDFNINWNNRTASGDTALHLAIEEGNIPFVKMLIAKNVILNLENSQGMTPAHLAVKNNNREILLLLKNKVDFQKPNSFGKSPVGFASEKKHSILIAIMLDFDQSEMIRRELNAAHLAIIQDNVKLMRELAEKQTVDFAEIDNLGWTPAMLAIMGRKIEIIKILAEFNINFNRCGVNKESSSHFAAKIGCPNILKVLLDSKANFNLKSENGDTSLHSAVEKNNLQIIKTLLDEKAVDSSIKNNDNLTPLTYAIYQSRWECAALLLTYPHPVIPKDWTSSEVMRLAIDLKNLEAVKAFAENSVSFTIIRTLTGKSVLMEAIENKELELGAAMLNINPKVVENFGWTPLHLAVASGEVGLFNKLKSNIRLAKYDNQGDTLAHIAIKNKQIKMVELLGSNQCDFTLIDHYKRSALGLALQTQQWQYAVIMLLSMPVLQILSSSDKEAIAHHRQQLCETFIEMSHGASTKKRSELVGSILEPRNKLGLIFKTPASLIKRLFSSEDTDDIVKIKRKLIDPNEAKLDSSFILKG